MIHIDRERCTRCGACIRDCVVNVITAGEDGYPHMDAGDERFCLNCQHCMAVCPAGALRCNGVGPEDAGAIGETPSPESMLNLLAQRRSIRQYRCEELEPEVIEALVKTLAWTPTGCNDHRLFFTVVASKSEMDRFRDSMRSTLKLLIRTGVLRLAYPGFQRYMDEVANGADVVFRNAPHMIVAATPKKAPCKEADPWIALSYFDLTAQAFGVGTCWSGFAVHAFNWSWRLRARLGMPGGYKVGAVLLFGRSAVEYRRQTAPSQFQIKILK